MRNARGFTLIELMIVVAIIGILAALAVGNLSMFACRAKTTEARTILSRVGTAQEAYRAEAGAYADNVADLSLDVKGETLYTISIVSADATTYEAQALGNAGPMVSDLWQIDENLDLQWTNVTAACR